jgi:putative methionine-R-sulfoxide reductase with GAF domain
VANQVVGVLDIDSLHLSDFSDIDRLALEDLNRVLAAKF